MSVIFIADPAVPFNKVLEASSFAGISVQTDGDNVFLTDGENCLHMFKGGDGNVYFEKIGDNDCEAFVTPFLMRFGSEIKVDDNTLEVTDQNSPGDGMRLSI